MVMHDNATSFKLVDSERSYKRRFIKCVIVYLQKNIRQDKKGGIDLYGEELDVGVIPSVFASIDFLEVFAGVL